MTDESWTPESEAGPYVVEWEETRVLLPQLKGMESFPGQRMAKATAEDGGLLHAGVSCARSPEIWDLTVAYQSTQRDDASSMMYAARWPTLEEMQSALNFFLGTAVWQKCFALPMYLGNPPNPGSDVAIVTLNESPNITTQLRTQGARNPLTAPKIIGGDGAN